MEAGASRLSRLRVRAASPETFFFLSALALAALFLIVVSGATVRLTGSGLGCENWPRCGSTFLPPKDYHALIEFGNRGVGFGAKIDSAREKNDLGEMFEKVLPEDLVEYGLIPEFIGRLPVVSAVHQLQKEDLVQILTEPKNALTRQYQRFFAYDNIELVFTEEALWEIAEKALKRETGARGLRSIIETALLDVMFELPSRKDVVKCAITKETIEKGRKPTLVTSAGADDEPAELAEESA